MSFGVSFTKGESSGLNLTLLSTHGVGGVAENLVRVNAFKSKNPLYTVTIYPSYVNGKDRADYTTKGSTFTVKLEVMDQLWPVKLYIYEGKYTSCIVSAGWSAFVRDNTLRVGDVCVFEVIMRDEVVFKVHIFRCPL
ncbi:b3 domain-containing transcription factor vrn1 [Quercus suber]|uniref:B3 domain-containing transcription factor vrn1 n=1 Tax=Quercus suber TaxID=58331 RepID=A0AAW0LYF5_QUESU